MAVLEYFQVFEQGQAGLVPRGVSVVVNQFGLKHAEEAFDDGVVVAVAGAAHAALDAVAGQQRLVLVAGKLHAPVAVMQ